MPQLPTNLVNYLQALEAIITMGVLIYAVVIARDIRESVKTRYLDGMKYVRDLLASPEAVERRRWVHQDLNNVARPLSLESADKVRAVCRDFDNIGLLCRKRLLPTDIIAETYSRNILEMWRQLKPSIDELRQATNAPYYFLEFEWLANQATKARESLVRKSPTETLRARS